MRQIRKLFTVGSLRRSLSQHATPLQCDLSDIQLARHPLKGDLKAANILVDQKFRAKVGAFSFRFGHRPLYDLISRILNAMHFRS
jgi:hypothetical protein